MELERKLNTTMKVVTIQKKAMKMVILSVFMLISVKGFAQYYNPFLYFDPYYQYNTQQNQSHQKTESEDKANNAFKKAGTHFNEKKYSDAIIYYRSAIDHWKDCLSDRRYDSDIVKKNIAIAHYNIAISYGNIQQYEQAIEACKDAIRYDDANDRVYLEMGDCYRALKQYQQAEQAFRKTIKINPNNGRAYAGLGLLYYFGNGVAEDKNTALFFFEKVLSNESSFDNSIGSEIIHSLVSSYMKRLQKSGHSSLSANPNAIIGISRPNTFLVLSNNNNSDLSFSFEGGNKEIDIITNDGDFNVFMLPAWCKATKKDKYTFTLTCEANKGNARSSWFNVSTQNKELKIKVSQEEVKATYVRIEPSEIIFDGIQGGSKDIYVYSDGKSYNVSDVPDWCSYKPNSKYFTLTCLPNKGASRTTNIKVTVDRKTTYLKIKQTEPRATYLRTDTKDVSLSALGETKNISVYTDGYTLTYSNPPSWLKVSGTTSSIRFSAQKNLGQKRSTVITLASGDQKTDITIVQPQEASYLNVQKNSINFSPKGGSQTISVETDGENWTFIENITWIYAQKNDNSITLKCGENSGKYGTGTRNGQLLLKSDNKTTTIDIAQRSIFNGPKGDERLFGFSAGYTTKQWIQKDENGTRKLGVWDDDKFINGIQAGVRIEPLFKYGFGLSTGLFYEYYFAKSKERTGTFIDMPGTFQYRAYYTEHSLYLPVHLEYRANISDNFQLFIEAGPSIDMGLSAKVTATEVGEKEPYYTETNVYGEGEGGMGHKRFNLSVDAGGGLRVNGLQLYVGTSFGLLDVSTIPNTSIKQNRLLYATLSWMIPHESWDDIPVNSADRGRHGTYGEHGLIAGYVAKQWEWKSGTYMVKNDLWNGKSVSGFRLGYAYQPSFGYGFGIATGLNLDTYFSKSEDMYDEYGSYYMLFSEMAINIPAHIEYRLHFAKNFSMFFEFGPSLDIGLFSRIDIKSAEYETYSESGLYGNTDWGYPTGRFNVYLDFIGGVRIWKFQLSAGVSRGLMPTTVTYESDWKVRQNRNLMLNLGLFF